MRALKYLAMAVSLLVAVPASAQIMDSTGNIGKKRPTYGDTVYSSTWDRISGKPDTATRWPHWHEIQGVPPVLRAGADSLDERYMKAGPNCGDSPHGEVRIVKSVGFSGGGVGTSCTTMSLRQCWNGTWRDRGQISHTCRNYGGGADSSDARLKDDIRPLDSALERLAKITGSKYRWKAHPETGPDIGVIAQDVLEADPDLVVQDAEDGHLKVRYHGLIGYLVEGINELAGRVEKLERERQVR